MIERSLVGKLSDVWLSSQTDLAEVIRWGKYCDANPELRKQSTDKHVGSLALVGNIALKHLQDYYDYDQALILAAIGIHDFPEGPKKKETLFNEKTASQDVEEYLIFKKKFGHLKPAVYEALEQEYLLQFAEVC